MLLARQTLKDKAFERWSAFILIRNADWRCYGSILSDLKAGFVKGRDEYPSHL